MDINNSLIVQWFSISTAEIDHSIPVTMSDTNYMIYDGLEGTSGAYVGWCQNTFSKKTVSSFFISRQGISGVGSGSGVKIYILIIGF